jgi:hypothetical protein
MQFQFIVRTITISIISTCVQNSGDTLVLLPSEYRTALVQKKKIGPLAPT